MRTLLLALAILLPSASAVGPNIARAELAFVGTDRGVPQIFVIRADGSGRRQLTSAPEPSTMPAWSPDGRRMTFVRHAGNDTHIYIMNADGGAQRPLTTDQGRAVSPTWSPDGTQIVFAAQEDGVSPDADGGHLRHLADDVYGDLSARPVFSWRPR